VFTQGKQSTSPTTTMRLTNFSRGAGVIVGLLVAVFAVAASAPAPHAPLDLFANGATVALAGSMLVLPAAYDVATLEKLRQAPQGGYEVYEDFLYDTATYVAAGPAAFASVPYFQTARADLTLSNLVTPGQLPIGQWFHGKALFATPRSEPTATVADTAAGRGADWDKIQNIARAILNFSLQGGTKVRPNIPLEALGGIGGGVVSFGTGRAAAAGPIVQQLRNHAHGGFPMDIIVKGGEVFNFNLQTGVQTAISADLPITLLWYGYRYVPAGRTG
jgi:hypothetical protein